MTDVSTTDRKPLYAAAGAADAAVASLRDLPARLSDLVGDEQRRADVRRRLGELPEDARALRAGFPDIVLKAQGRAADLPHVVSERFGQASRDAAKAYGEYATRGEGVVERLWTDYGPAVQNVVGTVRSRVADAADDVAVITDKATDRIARK